MMSNYSIPVTPVTAGATSGFGGGGGEGLWIFALLILFGGFGGGMGGRGGATSEVSGFELGKLSGSVADKDSIQMLLNSNNQGFAGLNTAINTSTTQIANGLSTVTFEIVNRMSALSSEVASCCCTLRNEISQGFGQVRYDQAQFAASINANNSANTQKVLDALATDKAERQAARISQLELKDALCGVVRYPNGFTYNAGATPFANPHNCHNHY